MNMTKYITYFRVAQNQTGTTQQNRRELNQTKPQCPHNRSQPQLDLLAHNQTTTGAATNRVPPATRTSTNHHGAWGQKGLGKHDPLHMYMKYFLIVVSPNTKYSMYIYIVFHSIPLSSIYIYIYIYMDHIFP